MIDNTEYPIYVQAIKRHYGALIHIFWYIATETSDKGADIAARALALLAPLPNAVSVYNLSQQDLGFVWWQALAFALAMEFALFAIIEVALNMWDGVLRNPKRYTIPLIAAVIAALGVLAIVVSVVYNLEVKSSGNWILASLPFISMFSFVALGLKRWHERNEGAAQKSAKRTVRTVQKTIVQDGADAQLPSTITPQAQAKQLKSEGFTNVQISEMLNVHRNTVGTWLRSTNGHNKPEVTP